MTAKRRKKIDRSKDSEYHKWLTMPIVQSLIYGRIIFMILLLVLQLLLFVGFFLWLGSSIEYFLAVSLFASIVFFVFLINRESKNEYKLAWLLPIFIFPLSGICFYILVHYQTLTSKMQKQISRADKNAARKIINSTYKEEKLPYPEIRDIVTYLKNSAFFLPYLHSDIAYYPSGEDAFPEMIRAMKAAKKFIFMEYFAIFPGVMWGTILDTLIEKRKEGVEIRIMYDGFGCAPLSPRSYQKYLRSLGLQAAIFTPVIPIFTAYLNNRDHRKICIVDGKTAFTGGINLSDQYINETHKYGYWKDTVIGVSGPAVRSFTGMFLELWDIVTETKEDINTYLDLRYKKYDVPGIVIPYSDNAYNNQDIAENVYYYIITQAKKYVHITTPYVIIDNQMMNALIFAARRGVDVTLIVPRTIDHFITFCTGRVFINTLVENGVRVYEFTPGFIHAKMFISDDTTAVVGSINLDYRSLFDQFEDAAFIYKHPVVAEIETDFQKTKAQSSEITKATYKKTPAHRRIIGRIFRVFAPLL